MIFIADSSVEGNKRRRTTLWATADDTKMIPLFWLKFYYACFNEIAREMIPKAAERWRSFRSPQKSHLEQHVETIWEIEAFFGNVTTLEAARFGSDVERKMFRHEAVWCRIMCSSGKYVWRRKLRMKYNKPLRAQLYMDNLSSTRGLQPVQIICSTMYCIMQGCLK